MHLYPLPLNGFSGNQWSRYRRRRTSTTAALNFSSCCSPTAGLRLPNLRTDIDVNNYKVDCVNITRRIELNDANNLHDIMISNEKCK